MRFVLLVLIAIVCSTVAIAKPKAEAIEKTYAKELQMVADTTRDPNAVQFRKVRLGVDGALCGEINAKNAFGGYVGFKPFFMRNNEVTIVTDEGRDERRDLSDAQWAWERKLDADIFSKACGE